MLYIAKKIRKSLLVVNKRLFYSSKKNLYSFLEQFFTVFSPIYRIISTNKYYIAIFSCVYLQIICINIQEMPINFLLELIFVLEKAHLPQVQWKSKGDLSSWRGSDRNKLFNCRIATLCHVLEEIYRAFWIELINHSDIIALVILEIL